MMKGRRLPLLVLSAFLWCGQTSRAQVEFLTVEAIGGGFGRMFAVVPDLDGDGVEDIAALSPGPRIVHIFSGATRAHLRAIPRPHPGASEFGFSIAGVRDIDGDGLADLAIGAPLEGNAGRVYVYSGATGGPLYTLSPTNPGFSCHFGSVLAGAPDWDNDGHGEIIVQTGGLSCKYMNVYSGATGGFLYQVYAENSRNEWGGPAILADLTGDGVPDLAAAASDYEVGPPLVHGRVYIFSGPTGGYIRKHDSPNPEPRSFGHPHALGDLDGDGVGDLLITAPYESGPGLPYASGLAYVFSGASGALLATLLPQQPGPSGRFGWQATPLPDVDGDGRADFAITGLNDSLPGYPPQAGVVYVYSGGTGRVLRAIGSPNPNEYPMLNWFGGERLGAMAGPGADRRATLLIDGSREGYGRVYLFPFCRADANADGAVNSRDLSHFITGWIMTVGTPPGTLPPPGMHHGDFNGDGAVSSADIAAFVTSWLAAVGAGGCP